MKQDLQNIIESLVDEKEDINIEEIIEEDLITYKVSVNKEEMGKVIGKEGRIAKAIRTIIRAVRSKRKEKNSS